MITRVHHSVEVLLTYSFMVQFTQIGHAAVLLTDVTKGYIIQGTLPQGLSSPLF